MIRRLSLLFACVVLAACSGPLSRTTPTPLPAAPTAAPTEAAEVAPSPTPEVIEPAATREASDTPTTESEPTTAPDMTSEPELTAEPETTAVAGAIPLDDPEIIAAALPEERDQIALAEAFKGTGDLPEVARTTPLDVKVGDVESFWVADNIDDTNYLVTATLRYAGPVALMYVDNEMDVDQADIEKSARTFEEEIYPRDHELFGQERSPGIDGDRRLTILNTAVRGAGGYFSSADSVVKAVNRFSNEREMFIIAIDSYPLGTDGYASTLAHEFQHMIESNQGAHNPSWFDEGMSTLAEDLNGYVDQGTAIQYLEQPDIQLTTWSSDAAQTGDHYGLSQLFMRYFHEHYAGDSGLAELIKGSAGNDPQQFADMAAKTHPDVKTFADLYGDWAVANVVNDPRVEDGRYAYELLPQPAALSELQSGRVITAVNQFGVDYLGVLKGPLTLRFDGAESVGLTPAEPASGAHMWYGRRGDESVSSLMREVDLSAVQAATLEFSTWYEIELDWDYAFVAVSTDDGTTWTTLKGDYTTTDDPQDANFGNGLTGVSGAPGVEPDKGTRGAWVEEKMDLTPYAGKKILLRFMLVQDTSYNANGILLDNIRIPEISFDDDVEASENGWQAKGFVRTTGRMPQRWELRMIRAKSGSLSVEEVAPDAEGRASVELVDGERGVLAVMGATPFTTEPANYSYSTGSGTVSGGTTP